MVEANLPDTWMIMLSYLEVVVVRTESGAWATTTINETAAYTADSCGTAEPSGSGSEP